MCKAANKATHARIILIHAALRAPTWPALVQPAGNLPAAQHGNHNARPQHATPHDPAMYQPLIHLCVTPPAPARSLQPTASTPRPLPPACSLAA